MKRYLTRHPSALSSPAAVSALEVLQQVQQHIHLTFAHLKVIAEAAGIADMYHTRRGTAGRSGGAVIAVIQVKHSMSASPIVQGLKTSKVQHFHCAGAGTGVFAEEEDGFDDALAGLDVDEVVAASQQGPQRQRSPPYGRSGEALILSSCLGMP